MISILTIREKTLIENIWDVIVEKFYTVDWGYYKNISIDTESALTPVVIVMAIFIAAVTATAISIFNKRTLGRLVRRLISKGAVGCENAVTLEEIGLDKSLIVKLFINRYALMRAVRCTEEDAFYGIDAKEIEEEISSIGVENTEEIKAPWWRKKATKKLRQNPENAYDTTVSENSDSVALENDDSVALTESDASHSTDETTDATQNIDTEYRIEDSYDAFLVAKVKYKRGASDHYYIRPSQKHHWAVRYDKKGTNPMAIVLIGAACLIGGSLVIKALPWFLQTLDELLQAFNSSSY